MSLDSSSSLSNPTSSASVSTEEDRNGKKSSGATSVLGNPPIPPRPILQETVGGVHTAFESQSERLRNEFLRPDSMLNWLPSQNLSFSPAPRTIRASPFEPLVHHRNLPKGGTISPLLFDEFYVDEEDHNRPRQQRTDPPVSEIRIPTPQQLDESICSVNGDTAPLSNCRDADDYKNLFFSGQRTIHKLQDEIVSVKQENRQLKRHLIELQKHLFSYSRNKRPKNETHSNSAWSVPPRCSDNRRKIGLESIVEEATVPIASSSSGASSAEAVSSNGVPKSVSKD